MPLIHGGDKSEDGVTFYGHRFRMSITPKTNRRCLHCVWIHLQHGVTAQKWRASSLTSCDGRSNCGCWMASGLWLCLVNRLLDLYTKAVTYFINGSDFVDQWAGRNKWTKICLGECLSCPSYIWVFVSCLMESIGNCKTCNMCIFVRVYLVCFRFLDDV